MPTGNAGFAAVANATQGAVNTAIQLYWTNLVSPVRFTLPPSGTTSGGPVGLTGVLDLLAPVVTLVANPQRLLSVRLAVAGSAQATFAGVTTPATVVLLAVNLQVAGTVDTSTGSVIPSLDLSQVVLDSLNLYILGGGSLPAWAQDALNSPEVLGALQAAIRSVGPALMRLAPPLFPNSFGSSGVTATFVNFQVVPLDGVLAVAADLQGYTTGDPTQLANLFTLTAPGGNGLFYSEPNSGPEKQVSGVPTTHTGSNLAVTVNADAAFTFLNGPVRLAVVQAAGSPVDHVGFSLGTYQLPLQAQRWAGIIVGVNLGSFGTVTLNLAIREIAPGSGTTAWLNEQPPPSWNVTVDQVIVAESALDYLLTTVGTAVLTAAIEAFNPILLPVCLIGIAGLIGGFMPTLVADLEQQIQQKLNASISSGTGFGSGFPVAMTTPLPGITTPQCTITHDDISTTESGLDYFGTFGIPNVAEATLFLNGARVSEAYLLDDSPTWNLSVTPTPGYFRSDDPTVRVGWQITVTPAAGFVDIFSSDAPITAADALTKAINQSASTYSSIYYWSIVVTIYRPLGTQTTKLWSQTVGLQTNADLDKGPQTYVRIAPHTVYFQAPKMKPGNYWTRDRASVLHKTNINHRCKNIERAIGAALAKGGPQNILYVDSLPSWADNLTGSALSAAANANRRGQLCDYCFFGGPPPKHMTFLA